MFYLSVFITVLLIGMVWFRSFQRNLYVLMNPESDVEKALAAENISAPSLFGFVWQAAGDIKGLVSGFLGSEGNKENTADNNPDSEKVKKVESGRVYILPLSDKK